MKPDQYVSKVKKAIRKIKTIKVEFIITNKDGRVCISGFID